MSFNGDNNNFWILNASGSIPQIPGSSTWIASEMKYFSTLVISEIDLKFLASDIQENMEWLNDLMSQILNEEGQNNCEQMLLLLSSPKKDKSESKQRNGINLEISEKSHRSDSTFVRQVINSSTTINPLCSSQGLPLLLHESTSTSPISSSLSSASSASKSKRSSSIRLGRPPLSTKQKPTYINSQRKEPSLKPFKLSKSPHNNKNSKVLHFYVSPSKNTGIKDKTKSRSPLKNITNLKHSSTNNMKELNSKASISPIKNYLKKNKSRINLSNFSEKKFNNDNKYKINKSTNTIKKYNSYSKISHFNEVQEILNDLAASKEADKGKIFINSKKELEDLNNNNRSSEESIERMIKDSNDDFLKEQKFTIYRNGMYKKMNTNDNIINDDISVVKYHSVNSSPEMHSKTSSTSTTTSIFKNTISKASAKSNGKNNSNIPTPTASAPLNLEASKMENKSYENTNKKTTISASKYDCNALIERLMAPTQASAAKLKHHEISPSKQQRQLLAQAAGYSSVSFNNTASSRPTTAERTGSGMTSVVSTTTNNTTSNSTVMNNDTKKKIQPVSNINVRPSSGIGMSPFHSATSLNAIQKSSIYNRASPFKTSAFSNYNGNKNGNSSRSVSPAKQMHRQLDSAKPKVVTTPLKVLTNTYKEINKSPLKLNLGNYRKDWTKGGVTPKENAVKISGKNTRSNVNGQSSKVSPLKIPITNAEQNETSNNGNNAFKDSDIKMKSFNLQKKNFAKAISTSSRIPVKADIIAKATVDCENIVGEAKKSFKKINIDNYKDKDDDEKASLILSNIKKSSDITSISFSNNKNHGTDLLTSTPNTSFKKSTTTGISSTTNSSSTISNIFKVKSQNNFNMLKSTILSDTKQKPHDGDRSGNDNNTLPEIYSDSSDDEDPKYLANWANSPELIKLLRFQKKNLSPEVLFDKPITKINLSEIFNDNKNSE